MNGRNGDREKARMRERGEKRRKGKKETSRLVDN